MHKAILKARTQSKKGPKFTPGTCAMQVRLCYGIASSGDQDKDGDADCLDVWMKARGKHPLTKRDLEDKELVLPRGVPLLFSGGSKGHGHIVITTGYGKGIDGHIWSPDTIRPGYFDMTDIDRVLGWMTNGRLLGWIEVMNGVTVYKP